MTPARLPRIAMAVAILAASPLLVAIPVTVRAATAPASTPGATTAVAHGAVPDPRVTGPVAGGSGRPVTSSPVPLDPAGYVEQEYFLSGTATGYTQVGTWASDGRWSVQAAEHADYETRILVRRPADPARFNGTVVVEWLDLPGAQQGVDLDPDFLYEHAELLRAGYAWVGVSAQQQGVATLRDLDPARYAALNHPGDTFSYSIFSQAAQALRHPRGVDPLAGLRANALIADGYSGSSARIVTYTNAIQPVDHLFAGVLVHSRWARSAPISQAPQAQQPSPQTVYTRTDLSTPVLTVETESEILQKYALHPTLDYYPATQADSHDFRLWEVPGTSHVDAGLDALLAKETGAPPTPCALPPNDGQENAVMDAALAQLDRWVRTGTAAATAPRIRVTPDASAIARDAYGNALGGVRTPALQAPTSTLTGSGNTGASPQCEIEGTTTPFTQATLRALYPTHTAYVAAVRRAAAEDVAAGFLIPQDAAQLIRAAMSSDLRSASSQAVRMMYRSVGPHGRPIAVTGFLLLPRGDAPACGWPVTAWGHGTTGVGPVCAPSRQANLYPDSDQYAETDAIVRLLHEGYAVVGTDYPGLGFPTTVANFPQADLESRAVIDSVVAARQASPHWARISR